MVSDSTTDRALKAQSNRVNKYDSPRPDKQKFDSNNAHQFINKSLNLLLILHFPIVVKRAIRYN